LQQALWARQSSNDHSEIIDVKNVQIKIKKNVKNVKNVTKIKKTFVNVIKNVTSS